MSIYLFFDGLLTKMKAPFGQGLGHFVSFLYLAYNILTDRKALSSFNGLLFYVYFDGVQCQIKSRTIAKGKTMEKLLFPMALFFYLKQNNKSMPSYTLNLEGKIALKRFCVSGYFYIPY